MTNTTIEWQGSPPAPRRPQPHRLTPREREVLGLLCEGLTNKEIARRLGIAAQTVKVHVGSILRALGASSRLQAVIIAEGLGRGPADSCPP